MGPGFLRGDARLKGFSISDGKKAWFFPLFYCEDNYHDPAAAIAWLRDICAKDTDKVFHNAMYDFESLDSIGIEVNGTVYDTMINEALLQETESVSLEATALRHLGIAKDEGMLNEAAVAFGLNPKSDMHKLPARYIGRYGEQDALLLPNILAVQKDILSGYGMRHVLELECKLLRVTWEMRKKGVKIDLDKVNMLDALWKTKFDENMKLIQALAPFQVDIWKPKSLARLCDHLHIQYNFTDAGNPSFENKWFQDSNVPVLQHIAAARNYDKNRRDFIEGQLLKYNIRGRVHGQFLTTRRDEGGTRSGRFASCNPNLQQVPIRDAEFGPAIRSAFIPDAGAKWGKFDYSSQEPRITLHLANIAGITGASEFVERYRNNPKFCQHSYAAGVLHIQRSTCKDINLGLTYGMGIPKLSYKLNVDMDEAAHLRREYSTALPFVEGVAKHYTELAENNGYVSTILGRRSWFLGAESVYAYKGLNRAVQGSGADLIKMAMVMVHEELGIVPLLTVHDEVDYNIYEEEYAYQIADIMAHAIDMTVPQYVEPEIMDNWSGQ